MNILIVDDNEKMRRTIKTFISDLALEIYECADGSGALPAYRRHQPDWVLMDLEMPLIDGLEATKQITTAYPDARIIIVTNYDGSDLRAAAHQAGARAFIVKEDLLSVRGILEKLEHRQRLAIG